MESTANCGQEFGPNLIKLAKKLLANQNLCKLLVNTDLDPLNPELHPDIDNTMELLHKNIRVVPLVTPDDETTTSKVVLVYTGSMLSEDNKNYDHENITIQAYVYVPYKEWLITGDSIRPFAIMAEVRKSLQNKRINGLGEIRYEGFDLSSLTNQMGSYLLRFTIGAFK